MKMTTNCHHLFLLCNTATKEDDNTLPLCYFQTQRRINTQENKPKKNKRREGAYLQAFALPLHFWLLLLPFCFKRFLLTSLFSKAKKKKK
jgi:hypothetical protein